MAAKWENGTPDLTNVVQNMFFMFQDAGSKEKTEMTLKVKAPQQNTVRDYLMHFCSQKQFSQQLKVVSRRKYDRNLLMLFSAENLFQLQRIRDY